MNRRIIGPNRSSRAAQHAAQRHLMVSHQIIQANRQRARQAQVHLIRRLMPSVVGRLPDLLVALFGIVTDARDLWISAERLQHIQQRRQLHPDAHLCTARLSEIVGSLRYRLPDRERTFEVVGYSSSADRYAKLSLKYVPSHDGIPDEWWVQTVHPFGSRKLRIGLVRGALTALPEGIWNVQ